MDSACDFLSAKTKPKNTGSSFKSLKHKFGKYYTNNETAVSKQNYNRLHKTDQNAQMRDHAKQNI